MALFFPGTALAQQVPQDAASLLVPLFAGAVFCAVLAAAAIVFLRLRAMRLLSEQNVLSDHVFSAFFGDASVGIAVLDDHGAIVRTNSVFENMVGYSEDDLIGMLYLDLVDHPDEGDVRERIVGALDRFGESRHLVLRRSDGALVRARFVVTPAPATLSRKNSVVFVEEVGTEHPTLPPDDDSKSRSRIEDPAARRVRSSTESASSGPQAAVDWTNVVGTLHDEIKTPLAVILGSASLLRGDVSPESADLVDAIETSSRRLLETMDGLLFLARLQYGAESPIVELFDVRAAVLEVAEAERPCAVEKGLSLSTSIPAIPVPARADREAVTRIVAQLVQNAVKFTENGSVHVAVDIDGTEVRIRVTDTGTGFDDETGLRLYRPFFQASQGSRRRHRGVGLGLTAVRQLIDRVGGRIEASSRSGEGATFTVHLPSALSVDRAA